MTASPLRKALPRCTSEVLIRLIAMGDLPYTGSSTQTYLSSPPQFVSSPYARRRLFDQDGDGTGEPSSSATSKKKVALLISYWGSNYKGLQM